MKTLPFLAALLAITACSDAPESYAEILKQKLAGLEQFTPAPEVQDSLYHLIKNQPEPDISVFDIQGNPLDLEAVKAKIVNIRLDYYRQPDHQNVQAIVIRKATKQEIKSHLKAAEAYKKNPVGNPPRTWRE